MKVFYIAYQVKGRQFTVKECGFEKAQDQVAQIMNAGGIIIGIKEEVEPE